MRIQAIRSSRIKWPLIASLSITVGFLLFAIPSHATVDWTEGFEYANQSAMNAVWTGDACIADASVMTPSTTRAFSGSRSLRMNYTGHQGITPSYHSCAMSRRLAAPTEVLYARWYMYMENFTVDATHTKVLKHTGSSYSSDWWGFHWGGPALDTAVEGIILDNGSPDTQEHYGPSVPQNQWVCVETQEVMSSPGVDNGIIRMWINGVLGFQNLSTRMRAAVPTLVSPGTSPQYNIYNLPTATFSEVVIYVQDGVGNIYLDDMAMSRDARIGCSGSTPVSTPTDVAPPAAPRGLTIQ